MTLHLAATGGKRINRIYAFCNQCDRHPAFGEMHQIVAIDEKGEYLGGHLSSSHQWGKVDIDHKSKHEGYRQAYPDGYLLEWIDEPEKDERIATIRQNAAATQSEAAK